MNPLAKEAAGIYVGETPIGPCGLAWTTRGVDHLVLPREDAKTTATALRDLAPGRAESSRPPASVRQLLKRLARHLAGKSDPFLDVPLDLRGVSPFARGVYAKLRRVPPGEVITYAQLARRAGKPAASRAVGGAMAANPVPLLVPCHRVVTADRQLGGFSGSGGVTLKARILFAEGVVLDQRHASGIAWLRRKDPVIKRIINRTGPYLACIGPRKDPFAALGHSIVYQQLSLKAAATIARRVCALTPGPGFPTPEEIGTLSATRLRGAGLSAQKASYLRDLAARVRDGSLLLRRLARLSDDAIVEQLTCVRGIGVWSAHMFLIFHLGRLDILPVGDLGMRNAVKFAYDLSGVPTPAEVTRIGERWRPYRSMASWYLWRNLDAGGL